MSKGHCTGALYSALAGAGFFPEAELDTYLKPESRLNGHPNRTYLPGVETNTGPLGHGLPVAVGIAVAAQIDGADHPVFARSEAPLVGKEGVSTCRSRWSPVH